MNDPALLELRRLAALVEAQHDELAELRRCLLDKADRRAGARLVPAIARLVGADPFTPASLASLVLNASGPAARTVADVIADHADADDGLRGFGRLLRRLRGVRFGHLRLVLDEARDRWRVEGFEAE